MGGITLGTRVRAVRFNDAEDALVVAAAAACGLTPNAWVRRACREAAALEKAVDGLSEREKVVGMTPVSEPGPRKSLRSSDSRSERSFSPDFK